MLSTSQILIINIKMSQCKHGKSSILLLYFSMHESKRYNCVCILSSKHNYRPMSTQVIFQIFYKNWSSSYLLTALGSPSVSSLSPRLLYLLQKHCGNFVMINNNNININKLLFININIITIIYQTREPNSPKGHFIRALEKKLKKKKLN